MLWTRRVRRDERQRYFGFLERRKLHLGFLRRFFQTLQCHLVFGKVDALILPELVNNPIDDALVEIVAPEVGVTVGRLHLDDAFTDLKDRNIKRPATEIVDGNRLVLLFV